MYIVWDYFLCRTVSIQILYQLFFLFFREIQNRFCNKIGIYVFVMVNNKICKFLVLVTLLQIRVYSSTKRIQREKVLQKTWECIFFLLVNNVRQWSMFVSNISLLFLWIYLSLPGCYTNVFFFTSLKFFLLYTVWFRHCTRKTIVF